MATKADVLKMLEKIGDNEPLFLLRGQDILAGATVDHWVLLAEGIGSVNFNKRNEATGLADRMRAWNPRKIPD